MKDYTLEESRPDFDARIEKTEFENLWQLTIVDDGSPVTFKVTTWETVRLANALGSFHSEIASGLADAAGVDSAEFLKTMEGLKGEY